MLLAASAIFISAFLLFPVQPMIAKMILPWSGDLPLPGTTTAAPFFGS